MKRRFQVNTGLNDIHTLVETYLDVIFQIMNDGFVFLH